ncbi:MAG TPA: histidine kinase N-terminal domain-containing protein [Actinomycetota bacterium]|nr:histidine kinase N-terminal domain-containing protein [Actinomycetota bacterium]
MALIELLSQRTGVAPEEGEHLVRLVAEWQLLADLAFSDLLLMCPTRGGDRLLVVAQMRPYTAQTVYQDDQVGRELDPAEASFTWRALEEGRIVREGDPVWREAIPIRVEAIPVRFRGRVVAGISQQSNLATARTPSRLELTYLQTAGDLARMIAEGTFPFEAEEPDPEALPRVGDGLVRLDATGRVQFASPNAVSAYRRLGITENLVDRSLAEFDPEAARVLEALRAGRPTESEVERRGAVVLRRTVPLIVDGEAVGAVVLLRDVTELRRRDRLLVLKDATIREIHHRVKNNLQTVASLLRMQARRMDRPELREALQESERRIRAIALVHETLSVERGDVVDFDAVAEEVVAMVRDGLTGPRVELSLRGSCGELSSDVATPLAVVITELVQNSVDHAFGEGGGRIGVVLGRDDGRVFVEVRDDGRGLPPAFSLDDAGLGLQIVRALVENELGGGLTLDRDGGTTVRVSVPVEERP